MDFPLFLAACLGGGLGSAARAALSGWVAGRAHPAYGTLAVNLSGSLAIGLGFGLWFGLTPLFAMGSTPPWLIIAAYGVLGGFTTVSTLALQGLELWRAAAPRAAMAHVLGSLIAGPALALAGFGLGFVLGDGLR